MNYNFFDFAKAYQQDLRDQADINRLYRRAVASQPAVRDRLLTALGNTLISLGEVVKSWRTSPELGGCSEVTHGRVQA